MKSDFGRGLIICLVKFAEHFMSRQIDDISMIANWIKHPKNINRCEPFYKDWEFGVKNWGSKKGYLSSKITLWANGATDHLYEIEAPEIKGWEKIRTKVNKLKTIGLRMGHGFDDYIWNIDELYELKKLTREIALMIDRKIGLNPDIGEW